ncbi:hypothetical protein [Myxococcus landrumensis]|uniref:Uncharacterized protein n=1 Tax=Myxococcus landrumensis TaxID=2813577 RepID=A0ABX7N7E3_9BACT|nr:hypothetical protein [Myxococcus landrumus]QSQ13459.1 hypothetical protein JY572_34795 [Myxococcus landrumus]
MTSVHHVYGALLYETPWRLHMVAVSALTALGLVGSLLFFRARQEGGLGAAALGFFALLTLALPVGMIGTYEGLYNHVLKNILFFGGASTPLLHTLFPPPMYELPNDFFFELTGNLQVVPAALSLLFLSRLLKHWLRDRKRPAGAFGV